MYIIYLLAWLVSVSLAQNSSNQYSSEWRIGSAPPADSQIFIEANNKPNTSNTVSFVHDPFVDTDNKTLAGNWTWTVKVSDVQVPANSSQLSSNSSVAYTTYEFTWPEDGNLDQALQAENAVLPEGAYPSCAYLFTVQFPDYVSKRFQDESNCTSILGAECVQNLTAAAAQSKNCSTSSFGILSGPAFEAACGKSFRDVLGYGWGVQGFPLGSISLASNSSSNVLQKNQTYAYGLSAPYASDNKTIFEEAKDNLHILMLTSAQTSLLCNRAGNGSSLATSAAVGRGSGTGVNAVGVVAVMAILLNVL